MEVSGEACSLAGHLGLGKLIAFTMTITFRLMAPPIWRSQKMWVSAMKLTVGTS